jgi:hypothetical protein
MRNFFIINELELGVNGELGEKQSSAGKCSFRGELNLIDQGSKMESSGNREMLKPS